MIEEIKKYDSSFDEAMFLSKVDHIFIMLLDAIMERDLSTVKHYLSDEIYNRYNNLINMYLSDKKIRLFDEMNVKSTHIKNVNITNDSINIEVELISRYIDYFINENGTYLSGNNTSRIERINKIIFTKKKSAKELGEARRCPNCGNTLDINNTGVCPYCNGIIDMSEYDYIITSLERN